MKQLLRSAVLVGLGLGSGMAFAVPGYVDDSGASVVRSGSGECLRTGRWTETDLTVECGKVEPAEIAAVETLTTELKPINLKADALFAFDSAVLTDQGRARLDSVMGQLPDESSLQDKRITITGFTDRLGPDTYNQDLSEKRARAVHDYLVSKGMRSGNVDVRGLGPAQPLVSCEDERGAALINCLAPNRRTTIEFSAMEVLKVEKQ
jgi:OOP family OmpA-OmpF porin